METTHPDFPDVIIILDNQNHIIGINPVGEQLLKMKQTDLIGKSVGLIFPQQSSSAYLNEMLKDGRKEVSLRFSEGKSLYAELTVSSIVGTDGAPLGRVLIVRDNTKSTESVMRVQQGEVFKKQNEMLRALQETTVDLHSSLDLNVVLSNVVTRACTLLGTPHGYLDVLRSGDLEPVVGVGALTEALKFKVAKGEGVAGTVWETGRYLLIDDYDQWQGRINTFKRGVIRAILGMPMILNEKVVGVIGVARGRENDVTFSEDDVSILKRFADLAVIAFQNARLFAQAQQEIEERRKTEREIRNANQILQLQIEHVELLQQQMQELAVRDPLTELYNRRYLKDALELELSESKREDKSLAVLMMDCDQLKIVNDKFGHKAGDDFLKLIADVIRDSIRAGDIACRYGGDEFVVVLRNVTPDIAVARAESLRKNIFSQSVIHRNEEVTISVSIGIAIFPDHGSSGEKLLQVADQAQYHAKNKGKNCVVLFTEG